MGFFALDDRLYAIVPSTIQPIPTSCHSLFGVLLILRLARVCRICNTSLTTLWQQNPTYYPRDLIRRNGQTGSFLRMLLALTISFTPRGLSHDAWARTGERSTSHEGPP